jgi:predicted DNA-binding ribbon-helix-helix protein
MLMFAARGRTTHQATKLVGLCEVARFANLPIVPSSHGGGLMGMLHERRNTKVAVVKRSIVIAGHKTSVSLEDQFWDALREIATAQGTAVGTLVSSIDVDREHDNLSSVIRLFVLDHYRAQADARRSAEGPIEKDHPVRSGRP